MDSSFQYPQFDSREVAGAVLARLVSQRNFKAEVVVVGLVRGGIPVADKVARQLKVPVFPLVVKKIGAPNNLELACGAIASDGVIEWNESVCRGLGLSPSDRESLARQARAGLEEKLEDLGWRPSTARDFLDKSVVIVDDGIATGASIRVAVKAVLRGNPREVCIAVPIAPEHIVRELVSLPKCDVLCLHRIEDSEFGSVGQWYKDFKQVDTDTCRRILSARSEKNDFGALHAP